jgi:hypothetical protein
MKAIISKISANHLMLLFTVLIVTGCGSISANNSEPQHETTIPTNEIVGTEVNVGTTNTPKLDSQENVLIEDNISPLLMAQSDAYYFVDFDNLVFKDIPEPFNIYANNVISSSLALLDISKLTYEITGNNSWRCSSYEIGACRGAPIIEPHLSKPSFFPSKDEIAIWFDESTSFQVWDLHSLQKTKDWTIPDEIIVSGYYYRIFGYPGQGLIFFTSAAANTDSFVVDTNTWTILDSDEMLSYIDTLQFSPDGKYVGLQGWKGEERIYQIWEFDQGRISLIDVLNGKGGTTSYFISSGGQYLASLNINGGINVVNYKTKEQLLSQETCSTLGEMTFSPDNNYLIYSHQCDEAPYSIQVLDINTGKIVMSKATTDNTIPRFWYVYPDKSLVEILLNLEELR